MECSLCGRVLFEPFSAQVFFPDGSEKISDNTYYSEVGAVAIYRHKDCVESKPALRKRRSGPRNLGNVCHDVRSDESEKFVKDNYRVMRKGSRFLMIVPKNTNGI